MRTFIRALRRAGIPVAYSQGFSPQPRLSFAAPLAVGLEGGNEYLDLYLKEYREEEELKEALNRQFPKGLKVKKTSKADLHTPPLSAQVSAALYVADLTVVSPFLQQSLTELLQCEQIIKERQGKRAKKSINIRPFIYDLHIRRVKEGKSELSMLLAVGSQGGARPGEIMELLPLEEHNRAGLYREDLFIFTEEGCFKNPEGIPVQDYFL